MTTALDVRRRWQKLGAATDEIRTEPLRIALLASYTIDPLVPYLGVHLHDARITAELTTGPYNQIAQQLLDDNGEIANTHPHLLVVVPRLEELGEDPVGDLVRLADLAVAAVERWRAGLVFVLPPLPDPASYGVGEHGRPQGSLAIATTARETVRSRLAGLPNVQLADAESALRTVGTGHAYRPAMFRYAKVPYTEDVFLALGRELAALIGLRFGAVCRGLVLDADELLFEPTEDGGRTVRDGADVLADRLRVLRESGVRVAVCGAGAATWPAVEAALGTGCAAPIDELLLDGRGIAAQLADVRTEWTFAPDQLVLLTTADNPAPGRTLVLGPEPDLWPAELADGGLFDRVPFGSSSEPPTAPQPAAAPDQADSLAAYVASLDVRIDWQRAGADAVDQVADMVLRTKDFTTGIDHGPAELLAWVEDAGSEIQLAQVRDRLGDYGTGVALALRYEADICTVELFLVSCPVLGRGVEQAALQRIQSLAEQHGCETVEVPYRDTGRNDLLADFVRDAAAADPAVRAQLLD